MSDYVGRPSLGSRVKMSGKHPEPYGIIEAYEHPGFASRAFIKLEVPARGARGYWCELYDFEVVM